MDVISFAQPQNFIPRRSGAVRVRRIRETPARTYSSDAETMLGFQQPARTAAVKKTAGQRTVISVPGICDRVRTHAAGLFRVLYRLRIVFAVLCVLAAAFSVYVLAGYISELYLRPLSFQGAESQDKLMLDAAMKSFLFPAHQAGSEAVDAGGMASLPFAQVVEYKTYTVAKGDSVTSIAKKFGLSNISTLISANDIDNARRIQVGQKMIIPSADGLVHKVAKNESLAVIGAKYNVSVETLLDVNDLSSSVLYPGDILFIPGARLASADLKRAMGELFASPLSVKWRLTSPYGFRSDPFTGVRSFHTGIDMAVPQGTAIRAAMDGRVAATGYTNVYGNYVIISHGDGYQTLYAHMMAPASVSAGTRVRQGDQVGKVGSTGYSTGPHLHFTVYKNGKTVNPFDFLN